MTLSTQRMDCIQVMPRSLHCEDKNEVMKTKTNLLRGREYRNELLHTNITFHD